jgi:hypothetical protein
VAEVRVARAIALVVGPRNESGTVASWSFRALVSAASASSFAWALVKEERVRSRATPLARRAPSAAVEWIEPASCWSSSALRGSQPARKGRLTRMARRNVFRDMRPPSRGYPGCAQQKRPALGGVFLGYREEHFPPLAHAYDAWMVSTANAPNDVGDPRSPYLGHTPFRIAFGLAAIGIVVLVLGIAAGRLAGAVAVAGGLLFGYVALYNLQIGRASKVANDVVSPEHRAVYFVGVIAPAWVWRGNALVVTGDDRELAAITVPVIAKPQVLWRIPISRLQRIEKQGGRIATLTLMTDEKSLTLRMSGAEASSAVSRLHRG